MIESLPKSDNDTRWPLAGMRVLDMVPGPLAAIARQLAELGADVVRIEPADGGEDRRAGLLAAGVSLDFVAANLGKRAASADRLDALAADADLVIAPRGAVDAARLRAAHPRLVILSVSDFGDTGDFVGWAGSGPVFHALSGELSRSGIPDREPLLPPGDLAIACAAVQAAYVALVSCWRALTGGDGDHLDFSVLDGAAQALDPGFGIAGSATAGTPASELPRGRPEVRFRYPILPCRDGNVRLCVLAPRQWRGLFEWMGRPAEFADPSFDRLPVRFASTTLLPAIARHFADRTRADIETEAQRFGVPAAAVLDLEEALATEQMLARRAYVPVEVAAGIAAPFPDGVIEIDGIRMGIAGPVPALPAADVAWHPREARTAPARAESGPRPFAGLRVIDLGVIVVGAETGRLLADQGADVIKVESSAFPDGSRQNSSADAISPTFAAGHQNKRSVGIDLRDPRGHALILELVRDADIVLSNFKGGTLESLGLDYPALAAINPRIIVTDSSAFGPTGPWSRRMGYGPLVRASAGLTMQWCYPGEPGTFSDAVTVYPDHVAGRIGAIGVIALLIRRRRTGTGGQVSVSQAEVMLSQLAPLIAAAALERGGVAVTAGPARSAVYRCAGDDEWCVVTLRHAADEQAVLRATGGSPLADWLAARAPDAAMRALQAVGVPAGAMLRVAELPGFDYYRERGFFRQTQHPHIARAFTVEVAPVRSERLPAPPAAPAPLTGEHTVAVLRERLAIPDDEIAALLDAGVLEQYREPAA